MVEDQGGHDRLLDVRAILRDYRLHGEALWERFNAGGEAQRWYLRALADGFAGVSDSPMVDDLQAAVGELEARVAAR